MAVKGFMGKLLFVDLSKGSFAQEQPSDVAAARRSAAPSTGRPVCLYIVGDSRILLGMVFSPSRR